MARAGPAGFYAGIVPEYVKVAPGVAIAFATYELVRDALGVPPGVAFR
jgi:solute carrier family 25 phosphate transporter 23/24/25/41